MEYDGFLSYSHAADGRLAPQLQKGVQSIAKPWWKRKALRVFRDETGLSASPQLWSAIEESLAGSEWFVLMASPESAASEWVGREVSWWVKRHGVTKFLPVVTGGDLVWDKQLDRLDPTRSTAIPANLFDVFEEEPRWVDLRWARTEADLDLRNARFRAAVADVAAPLRGVAKDDLESEEIVQHRRTVRTALAAGFFMFLLAVSASAAGFVAVGQRDQARVSRDQAESSRAEAESSRAEAESSRTVAEANARVSQARSASAQAMVNASVSVDRALLLGVLGVSLVDDFDTRRGLLTALEAAGPLVGFLPDLGLPVAFGVSADGSEVATLDDSGSMRRWSTSSWELLAEGSSDAMVAPYDIRYIAEDGLLVVSGLNGAVVYDADRLTAESPVLGVGPLDGAIVVSSVDPTGDWFVANEYGGAEISVGRTSTGAVDWTFSPACEFDFDGLYVSVLAQNGLLLVTCQWAGGLIYSIDFDNLRPPTLLASVEGGWTAGAISPAGDMAVFTDFEGAAIVVDPESGAEIARLDMPSERSFAIEFDGSGRFLAIGGENATIRVWDLIGAFGGGVEIVGQISGLGQQLGGVGFSSVGIEDRGEVVGGVESLRLMVGSTSGVSEWDVAQTTVVGVGVGDVRLESVAVDKERGVAFIVPMILGDAGPTNGSGPIQVVSSSDGSLLGQLDPVAGSFINHLDLSPDGDRLLVIASDTADRLLVVSADDGTILDEIRPEAFDPGAEFWDARWSPDGVQILVRALTPIDDFTAKNTIGVFDVLTGEFDELPLDEIPSGSFGTPFWSTNQQLAILSLTGGLTLVDLDNMSVKVLEVTPGYTLRDVDRAPGGHLLVTSESGEMWLVDPDKGVTVGAPYRWGGTDLQQGAISDDGSTVAALGRDGSLSLWDGPSRVSIANALQAYRPLGSLSLDIGAVGLVFLGDGRLLTTSGGDLSRWTFESDELMDRACGLVGRDFTAEEWRTFVDTDSEIEPVCS